MPRSRRVRWGILGTGGINERFLQHVREAPNAEFVAVGRWYDDFTQVNDDEVVALLAPDG